MHSSFTFQCARQARAAVLTAAQCATYNESKKFWMWLTGGGDDFATHLGSSMITGLVTTTATGPVDVIKTNMFVGRHPCPALLSSGHRLVKAVQVLSACFNMSCQSSGASMLDLIDLCFQDML